MDKNQLVVVAEVKMLQYRQFIRKQKNCAIVVCSKTKNNVLNNYFGCLLIVNIISKFLVL